MSLELSPMTEEDLYPSVPLIIRAFTARPGIGSLLGPNPVTDEVLKAMAEHMRTPFKEDSTARFLKVTDTETGEMVSCSRWNIYESARSEEEVEKTLETPPPRAGAVIQAHYDFMEHLMGSRRKYMGTRPHITLRALVTDPKHHRRGAGALHLKWGCEEADRLGLVGYLEASEMGRPLYAKFGFEVVHVWTADLAKYGGEGYEENTVMIRQPRPRDEKRLEEDGSQTLAAGAEAVAR